MVAIAIFNIRDIMDKNYMHRVEGELKQAKMRHRSV